MSSPGPASPAWAGDAAPGPQAIVLVDLAANLLCLVILLVIAAMALPAAPRPAPGAAPPPVPILAGPPAGAAATVDALYRRTQRDTTAVSLDVRRDGVRVKSRRSLPQGAQTLDPAAAAFPALLPRLVGAGAERVDIFVFDPVHHRRVREALDPDLSVREYTVPAALRAADGADWSPAFTSLFGRAMNEEEFRDRLARLLAGDVPTVRRPATAPRERGGLPLGLLGRLVLFGFALAVCILAFRRIRQPHRASAG